uniref:ATP-binding cassette sub-family A member 3-like n=1 Tax=Ictidomys tridecemlineatus TaxID=43179 RepID=UPI001A9F929F|nr:ATP-binding cassette sub-family A member 3-like [Ictidomys tridecemlineatus]
MDLLTLNQFAVLMWKNFTLKRRKHINSILEIFSSFIFPVVLLVFHILTDIKSTGPYNFTSQSINTLPSYIKNASDWELIYIPSNIDVVKEITENVKRNLNISLKVRGFSSESEFEKYILYDYESQKVLAAIVFDCDFKNSSDPLPLQVKYHLRFTRVQRTIWWPDKAGWKTAYLFPDHPSQGPRNPNLNDGGSPGYIKEGFLIIQHALDKAIMLYHESNLGKSLFDGITIFVQRFPFPAHPYHGLLWVSSPFLPLIFILTFSPVVLSIMQYVVQEKEERLKEYQLIIGLRNWIIWAAYFFTFFLLYIIIITLICVLFFIKANEPILRYSDYSFIFIFLVCYAIASIFFSFMVSTFFNKAHLAASAGHLMFFASFFPFNFIFQHYGAISVSNKVAACLSSNVALALGINLLVKLEIKEIGVKWHNLWKPASLDDNLIFGYMLGMLLLDAFLYGLVTWYVETVFPGQSGVPQPWYFFLLRSYWFRKPRIIEEKNIESHGRTQRSNNFEAEPINLVAGIQIKHLHKEFSGKAAVKDLSLNVYEGQVTILLGHNGAGKTTALSVLTGCYPPTRGEAFVNGFDISDNMIEIRKNLGFCPQNDLLFKDLTLAEHLFFYSVIKGMPRNMHTLEIDHMLSIFDLLENRHAFSSSLSEGAKRKLSVIIALIGGSKVIILDEPSSGMDPVSKRLTWNLLMQYKHNRTILVTTPYMDEADTLGDRIAILAMGTLQCCGSSMFLKQIYGAGYHIVMQREPHCDVEKISAMIQSHVPGAMLEDDIGDELSFVLPKEYTHRFEALFDELEKNQKELGIANFGVSITTMKEVFFKVNKLATSQMSIHDQNKQQSLSGSFERPVFSSFNELATIKFNTGFPLYRQQFCSMFIKRALFSWRNWKLILLQIIVILVVTTYLLIALNVKDDYMPAREMDLRHYGQTIVPYSISGNSGLALTLIKKLEIFLKSKNQELRKVKGNVQNYILESKECRDFCIIALSIKVEKNKTILTVLFNNEAYHSSATSLAVLDNILFMLLSGPRASITVSNKPQPLPVYGSNTVPINGLQIVQCLAFGISIVAGSFCLQTVIERISKAKHIQFLSGVYVLTYWLSALLWDLICFSIPCCLLLGVFKYCEVDAFVVNFNFLDTMLIFMLYGWCIVPLMYLGSFLFSSGTAASIKLTLFNYISIICSIIVQSVLQFYENELSFFRSIISNVLMVLPSYNFAMSISRYFDDYEVKKLCAKKFKSIYLDCNKSFIQNNIYSFGEHGIAKFLITLAVMGLVFLLLLFSLETAFWSLKNFVFHNIIFNFFSVFTRLKTAVVPNQGTKEQEDEAVIKEKNKVLELLRTFQTNPVLLNKVTKIYYKCPVVRAIRNISLVVKKSECFGLLGLNGAGKTTIFKMITGEETITSGVVLIDGNSVTENIRKIRSRIGYGPQSDSVLNHMTGRELLIMYARLWGVPESVIYKYVEAFLCSVHLEPFADNVVYTYSGGNKRRLSTAIALMGKSSVVLLDEPSTGMDPVTRHLLWDTVTWICKTGKAIIITSHSMEECEALCSRLAIMVKGMFVCLGSPRHVRNKFGNIHTLTAKINISKDEDKVKEFKKFVEKTFPGNIQNQEYQGIIGYFIPSKEICWGKVFSILEKAKVLFNLEDYSISQITLEQIFLTFANIDKKESTQSINLT